MVVSLEEIKLYLRVDGEEEDALISTFINVSEDLVEGILRYPVSEFEVVPEIVKQAVMYSVANMYEKREDYDVKEVIDIMTKLLFSYRKDEW
ncbi:head-tail connector protein [Clostridium celatum]|uniref:head-tail connector protein n=1 Tax=Clostridium celatum TaxID=36834 RepID=UPI0029038615|nr:head-tail connector protein [Clostridium celatum]MDU2265255.1 head-tail connector protein [Clostridium celatum]MDU6295981.1 head-tail connector protein [Clostridium celatum]